MTETEFNALAEATLKAIANALESSDVECDCEFKGDAVLEIEFDDGSKMVVNRHGPAREIWVAARSGGFHFRLAGARWVNTKDGTELFGSLSRLVSQQSGRPVTLRAW